MTLAQLIAADLATQRQYALVFTGQLAQTLGAKWAQYGSTNLVPTPTTLTDGRYMLCADILSEVQPGGLLERMWANSDVQIIAAGVTVMPWSEAVALLPQQEGL